MVNYKHYKNIDLELNYFLLISLILYSMTLGVSKEVMADTK